MPDPRPAVLILGTADWNQPIATNQHFISRELSAGDYDVTFVESLALRRPTLSGRDVRRIFARLRSAFTRPVDSAGREVPRGMRIISPLVFPFHRGIFASLNRPLLRRSVRKWVAHPGPRILWAYTPTTYGIEKHADVSVYHCVDLLHTVPGIDALAIDTNERRLAAHGFQAVASSEVVQQSLLSRGFTDIRLWENVADTGLFSGAVGPIENRIPRRAVFAGNISPTKIDFNLLEALARAGLQVRIAGPRGEGGDNDSTRFSSLLESGVEYLGMLSPQELAEEMATASLGLIPYLINPYTRGVSPLKTYEYLAAGLAVVSTDLPGVRADGVDIFREQDVDSFISRALRSAALPTRDDIARRAQKSERHSWVSRGEAARALLENSLAQRA